MGGLGGGGRGEELMGVRCRSEHVGHHLRGSDAHQRGREGEAVGQRVRRRGVSVESGLTGGQHGHDGGQGGHDEGHLGGRGYRHRPGGAERLRGQRGGGAAH